MKRMKIATCPELKDLIIETGFIPLFENEIEGFSVMNVTRRSSWWTGRERTDPWVWRMLLSEDPDIAYGKLFGGRAGFVSREWLPYFAAYRRDGYDFDARYEDGRASHKCRKIIGLFEKQAMLPSFQIKVMAGFSKNGEKGFEGALTLLQMQTYITVRRFTQRRSRAGDYYGWHVGVYSLTEKKFGYRFTRSAYRMGAVESKERMISRMMKANPGIGYRDAERFLK
ncbi:MAG: hypothetical protein JW807_13170 [Spirochaetes bacterium]|nr:hypothetical protein [Spirochaetota bacterium]